MASDPVSVLPGIGPKTKEKLNKHNIITVKQLAEADPSQISVNAIRTHIKNAKLHMGGGSEEVQSAPKIVLGGGGVENQIEDKKNDERKDETKTETTNERIDDTQYLISDHTWFECKVVVPDQDSLNEVIVYELSIEPGDRISFVCEWVDQEELETDEPKQVCTMSYSPQLLLHFNPELPPLRVSMLPEDLKALPNKHVFENVLWEISMMQRDF